MLGNRLALARGGKRGRSGTDLDKRIIPTAELRREHLEFAQSGVTADSEVQRLTSRSFQSISTTSSGRTSRNKISGQWIDLGGQPLCVALHQ